jgi:hypothetical protein
MSRTWLPAVLVVAFLPVGLLWADDDKELLKSVKDRMKVEAQRVEREFTEGRAAAYKLVRSDDPKLEEASDKLRDLLRMVEKDKSLESTRREQLIKTLKWDLDRVKEIAAERRKATRKDYVPPSVVRRERESPPPSRTYDDERRSPAKDAKSTIDKRKELLKSSDSDRKKKGEGFLRVNADVIKSSEPDSALIRFSPDHAEKMRKRGSTVKMTAKEKAIMEALNKTLDLDLSDVSVSEVIDLLKKKTGIEIAADKRGLDDAGVTYDTKLSIKMKASTRNVIRKILADLGLAYYIKDEVLQITSLERARQQTTIRTYYVGDLAMVTDTRIPYALGKLQAINTINTIIDSIRGVEPQSWQSESNPDAPGTIVFDPVRMTLIIKQTAEFHFRMSGK